MASFNRVILVGNVTRDPELRYVPSGMAVTDIGLAVNDRRKKATTGEWIEETTFVDVTLWGGPRKLPANISARAAPVLIEGRLKLDSWEGADGQKRSKLKVVGEKMQLLGAKGGGNGGGGGRARPAQDARPAIRPKRPRPTSLTPHRPQAATISHFDQPRMDIRG